MAIIHKKSLAFLSFENGGNLGEDASGNLRDGVASNVTQVTQGSLTNAGSFNGTTSQVNLDSYAALASFPEVSFSVRIYANSVASGTLVSISEGAQTNRALRLSLSGGNVVWSLDDSTGSVFSLSSPVSATTETLISVSAGLNGAELWVDGVSVGSDGSMLATDSLTPDSVRVGCFRNGAADTDFYDGVIKDAYIGLHELDQGSVDDIDTLDLYGFGCLSIEGQSNAQGYGTIRGGTDDDYTGLGDHYQWDYPLQQRTAATNPLQHLDPGNGGKMGPWRNAALSMLSDVAYKRGVLWIPIARGGRSLCGDFSPGDTDYENGLTSYNAAFSSNKMNALDGWYWVQGENDSETQNCTDDYATNLTTRFNDKLARFEGFFAHSPYVAVEIRGDPIHQTNVDSVNADNEAFAIAHATGTWVDTSLYTMEDTLHFDAPSIDLMGASIATGWLGAHAAATAPVFNVSAYTYPADPRLTDPAVSLFPTFDVLGSHGVDFTINAGTLDSGLSLNGTTGEIYGTFKDLGVGTFTVRATNDTGFTDFTFNYEVFAAPGKTAVWIMPGASPTVTEASLISYIENNNENEVTSIQYSALVDADLVGVDVIFYGPNNFVPNNPGFTGNLEDRDLPIMVFDPSRANSLFGLGTGVSGNSNTDMLVFPSSPLIPNTYLNQEYAFWTSAFNNLGLEGWNAAGYTPSLSHLNSNRVVCLSYDKGDILADTITAAANFRLFFGWDTAATTADLTADGDIILRSIVNYFFDQSLEAPSWDSPAYDNNGSYLVGDTPTLTPSLLGGSEPITYAVATGALGTGQSLDVNTGVITGALSTAESVTYTISATNSEGSATSASVSYTVNAVPNLGWVSPEPIYTSPTVIGSSVNVDYYVRQTDKDGAVIIDTVTGTTNVGGYLTIDNEALVSVGNTIEVTLIEVNKNVTLTNQTVIDLDA